MRSKNCVRNRAKQKVSRFDCLLLIIFNYYEEGNEKSLSTPSMSSFQLSKKVLWRGSFNLIKVMNITFSKRLNVIRMLLPPTIPSPLTPSDASGERKIQIKWKSLVLIFQAMKIKTRKVIENFLSFQWNNFSDVSLFAIWNCLGLKTTLFNSLALSCWNLGVESWKPFHYLHFIVVST